MSKKKSRISIKWHIGKAFKQKDPNPRHKMFFTGDIRYLTGNILRRWVIQVRLFNGKDFTSLDLRPDGTISVSEVFDLIREAIDQNFSDAEIQCADDLDAVISCKLI